MSTFRPLLVILTALLLAATAFSCDTGPSAEDKRYGLHCVSSWDGNHDGFEALVRARLNDPGSMKTYETKMGVLRDGKHKITMSFGAKNAFGSMVRLTAQGQVNPKTCKATLDSIH